MFSDELALMPPALFDEWGVLRKSSKATLIHALAVCSEENIVADVSIVDGKEVLYQKARPRAGKVKDLVQTS